MGKSGPNWLLLEDWLNWKDLFARNRSGERERSKSQGSASEKKGEGSMSINEKEEKDFESLKEEKKTLETSRKTHLGSLDRNKISLILFLFHSTKYQLSLTICSQNKAKSAVIDELLITERLNEGLSIRIGWISRIRVGLFLR